MDTLKAGDIIEYTGEYEIHAQEHMQEVGIIVRLIPGEIPEKAEVAWLMHPQLQRNGKHYIANLRKLGEVQHD